MRSFPQLVSWNIIVFVKFSQINEPLDVKAWTSHFDISTLTKALILSGIIYYFPQQPIGFAAISIWYLDFFDAIADGSSADHLTKFTSHFEIKLNVPVYFCVCRSKVRCDICVNGDASLCLSQTIRLPTWRALKALYSSSQLFFRRATSSSITKSDRWHDVFKLFHFLKSLSL